MRSLGNFCRKAAGGTGGAGARADGCHEKDAWVLSIMGSVTLEQLHAYAPGVPR